MTDRLYYNDSYLREFEARIIRRSDDGGSVYLDRTALYPASGGQPFDTGTIGGAAVIEVIDEGEEIAHRTAQPVAGETARCTVDWARRFDHMQQHTGQHLLSAVFQEHFRLKTVSFHLGQESATIDLETPSLEPAKVLEAERLANEAVFENRQVTVSYEDAAAVTDLRKPSGRDGTLRVVTIADLDRSACGGTHVRATGEIGVILLGKLEKVRATMRVEFFCGARTVRRARADYDAVSRIAQLFSATPGETPDQVAALLETSREAEKASRRLQAELAGYQGRELYAATEADANGLRRVVRMVATGTLESLRALAASFTAQPKSVFIAAIEQPPAVLLAVSADAGIDAGKTLQPLLGKHDGRGGGSARMAQGGVPSVEMLEAVLKEL
ncbi:MAG: alanyl-tRNA editing protein [Candidatus Solibacter usitatus]|nr:alanyl-tRNA editing protein [Candidatus Solibacter usitatus]